MTTEPPIDFDFSEGQPERTGRSAERAADGGTDADSGAIHPHELPGGTVPVRALPPLVGAGMPRTDRPQAGSRAQPARPARPGAGKGTRVARGICAAIGAVLVSALVVLGLRALDRAIRGTAIAPALGSRSDRAA